MQPITPDWIQTGELGLAFVVVVLCSGMIVYVLRTSTARENKLLDLLNKYQQALDKSLDGFQDIHNRLLIIEKSVGVKATKKPRVK